MKFLLEIHNEFDGENTHVKGVIVDDDGRYDVNISGDSSARGWCGLVNGQGTESWHDGDLAVRLTEHIDEIYSALDVETRTYRDVDYQNCRCLVSGDNRHLTIHWLIANNEVVVGNLRYDVPKQP